MAAALLLALGFALLGGHGACAAAGIITTSVREDGDKTYLTCSLNGSHGSHFDVTGHRWLKGDKLLKEDELPGQETEYMVDTVDRSGAYSCVFLPEPMGRADISVNGPPKIKPVKKSEHANEGETAILVCKSESHPPITHWVWFKLSDSENQPIANGSQSKFMVSSTEEKSELSINNLDMNTDPGTYVCNATNSEGSAQAEITLRVRSRLAALWPFLGIVAEVLVLITIIFIYEKRRKPDQAMDEDDPGSAPLKSSGHHLNDKDKNVRQRNAT
ncbi:basigin [Nannospalax galili]|uniref:Basigin n=1 Tax=Nannospalax galili TaxID=1026970 RepID=A0A8C6QH34_NANGA|nr:basigin [Nannospalax galili]